MDDAPVEIVIPEEGSISIPYVISLVKGAPHEEAGKKLINFTLSDEGQKLFARSYVRPIRDIEIDPEISARMLPGSDYKRVISPDFSKMKDVQATAMERWISEVMN
jgi:putative spermidine/putrescine transport system substrate-binding protein